MFDATQAAAAAKAKAEAFVRDQFDPAVGEALDGGVAIERAVVDSIFFHAAYHDRGCDMETVGELLEVARQAIDRGRAA